MRRSRRERQQGSGCNPGLCTFSALLGYAEGAISGNFPAHAIGEGFWASAAFFTVFTRFAMPADSAQRWHRARHLYPHLFNRHLELFTNLTVWIGTRVPLRYAPLATTLISLLFQLIPLWFLPGARIGVAEPAWGRRANAT